MSQTPVVVFGIQDLAQLAKYYLETDSPYKVVAFTVHQNYLPESREYLGLPVVPFETVEQVYKPADYKFFSPITGRGMNRFREKVWVESKNKGYKFITYVSSKASIFNTEVGENCFILEDNTIQPFVSIGNNVVIWSGCHIGHHSVIQESAFLTSHVVVSGHCDIGRYSWLGVNSSVRDSIRLAEGTFVGMGAVVTKNTDSYGVYLGIPGKKQEKTSLEVNP